MYKPDFQLQRDVIDELRFDPAVGNAELGVAANNGVVTLTGSVHSFAMKYAATHAAERVAGVRAIADDLVVSLPSDKRRSDTDIAHSVASTLKWDVQIPDTRIQARVREAWVWLEGDVDWQFEADAAERAVRNLTGVRGVTSLLSVKKRPSAPDVKQRIESALKRHAEIDAKNITVEALEGRVMLRGTVRSWAERKDAERAAWSAPGVIAVDDDLAVQV